MQLGRFWQVDPKADEAGQDELTPYHFAYNNPVSHIDLMGDEPEPKFSLAGAFESTVKGLAVSGFNTFMQIGPGPALSLIKTFQDGKPAGDPRASLDENGNITAGFRPPAASVGEGIRNLGSDVLDKVNVASTVASGGGSKALTTGAGLLFAKTGAKTALTNQVVNQGKSTLKQQGADIAKKINTNSVTIKTVKGHTRYDVAGAAHRNVETPHSQSYKRNVNPKTGETNLSSESKHATPMNQQDMRNVKNYLKKQGE